MPAIYDPLATKKPTNLSINADLLRKAKELDINISATVEQALAVVVSEQMRVKWLAENQRAIDAYNENVTKLGVFSDATRTF